jgi:hypothetical protein
VFDPVRDKQLLSFLTEFLYNYVYPDWYKRYF